MKRTTIETPAVLYSDSQRSEHTARNARYRLQTFARWLEAEYQIADLERVETRHILDYKASLTHLAPSSQARIVETLRGFFRWVHAEGLIERDPAAQVKAPRPTLNKEPEYLELAETRKLIQSVDNGSAYAARDRSLVWILSYGLRVGEVAGLNVGDLIEPKKRGELPGLRITGKGVRQRVIPIAEEAHKAITKYLDGRGEMSKDDPLFTCVYDGDTNRRMTTRAIQKRFTVLCEAAKIAPDKAHPHAARHGFAMRMLFQAKVPGSIYVISRMLGHSSISTTEKYLHSNRGMMEKAVLADPLARRV